MKKIRIFVITFTSLCIILAVGFVVYSMAGASGIYENVVRLHVLAESDSEEDQTLKIKVRDDVLSFIEADIEKCASFEEAYSYIGENTEKIKEIADERIRSEGFSYDSDVIFCKEYYPTREYGDSRLPAGDYISLRIVIGNGEGHNWWCVLYPPLCTSSSEASEELAEAGFTPNQVRLITDSENEGYVLKFRIVETIHTLFGKIKKLFR